MTPTPEQLKTEIETGPLAASLLPLWNGPTAVFPSEPEPPVAPLPGSPLDPDDAASVEAWAAYQTRQRWERIRSRFGRLTSATAHDVLEILRRPDGTTRDVPRVMALTDLVGLFAPSEVAAVFTHDRFPEFRDTVNNQDHGGAKAMADLFAGLGVISAGSATAFATYANGEQSVPCSRLTALDWTGVDYDLLAAAKGV